MALPETAYGPSQAGHSRLPELEDPPTALWTTAADDFAWKDSSAQLIFLEWKIGIIVRRQVISSDLQQILDEDWTPNIANGKCHFLHKANWWAMGNQGLDKTADVFTVWTQSPIPSLPLQLAGFQPPLSLIRPMGTNLRSYFNNMPLGQGRHCPGQHVWTDGSKIETPNTQLVGAGVVRYMPAHNIHFFRVG
eukprot:680974-Rhodomonas_salina.10